MTLTSPAISRQRTGGTYRTRIGPQEEVARTLNTPQCDTVQFYPAGNYIDNNKYIVEITNLIMMISLKCVAPS